MKICPECNAHFDGEPAACPGCGHDPPPRGWPEDPLLGRSFGDRYRLVRRIGVGGMGVVYEAVGREEEAVAIKTLRGRAGVDEALARRFRREARALSALRGAHVCRVHDAGELPDGTLWYAMDLLGGESVSERLVRKGPFPATLVVPLLRQLCEALTEAHDLGLVHRDLKPDNLQLVHGPGGLALKVLDFGIVKILDPSIGTVGSTRSGAVFGTPEFMSPEQVRGEPTIDERSDVYSAGICVFVMLTGRLPFEGATPQAVMMARLGREAPSLSEACPERAVPEGLERLVVDMLRRDRDHRLPSMRAVSERLDLLGRDVPSLGPDALPPEQSNATPAPTVVLPNLSPAPPGESPSAADAPLGRRLAVATVAFLAVMGGVALLLSR